MILSCNYEGKWYNIGKVLGGRNMPIVTVQLLEGRSDEQLKNLVKEVTNAVESTTNADRSAISVVIQEMKKEHYGVAGVRKSDK